MPHSTSSQNPFAEPPANQDDPAAWSEWALEFLGCLCRMWSEWRESWTVQEVPQYRTGNPDAWLPTDRETRIIGYSPEWVTGPPPPGLSRARGTRANRAR